MTPKENHDGKPARKTAPPEFTAEADAARNLFHVRYHGHVTAAMLQDGVLQVESLLAKLRPGFTVLTDLSGLESMELDCAATLARVMDLCKTRGVGTVVRVIPDPAKDIGFNILSIIHLRRGVKVVTCDTVVEAEQALKTKL